MRKWLFLIVIPILLMASPVSAATSVGITVSYTGWIGSMVSGLTITYIADDEVRLDWTNGPTTNMTMIRAAVGRIPTDIEDGYLAFLGTNTTTSYTDTSLDVAGPSSVYYELFSNDFTGFWAVSAVSIDTEGLMSISWFLMVIVIMGLVLWLVAVVPRRKNLLVSTSTFLIWMGIGFWWIIGDIFTTMGMTGDYLNFFYYVPFVLAFGAMLEYMTRANQVEIQRKMGGQQWSEFGTPPKAYKSNYDQYKAELHGRTRRGSKRLRY